MWLYSPFKLHNHTSGILILHNSSVTSGIPFHIYPARETVNAVITRNNLFIGTSSPALLSTGRMINCDFDSDGYGWFEGPPALQSLLGRFAEWNTRTYASPEAAQRSGALYRQRGAIVLSLSGELRGRPRSTRRFPCPLSGSTDGFAPRANFARRKCRRRLAQLQRWLRRDRPGPRLLRARPAAAPLRPPSVTIPRGS